MSTIFLNFLKFFEKNKNSKKSVDGRRKSVLSGEISVNFLTEPFRTDKLEREETHLSPRREFLHIITPEQTNEYLVVRRKRMQNIRHFFPGGNTPQGFFSYYGEILDVTSVGRLAVIKGGPGTGKSTFMKQLGEALEKAGESVTYLHCSSDPYSLDGLFLKRYNSAIVDGTAPHVTDPRYPGGADILLNFCDAIGEEQMAGHGEALRQLNREISENFRAGYCCLNAAASIGRLMEQKSS